MNPLKELLAQGQSVWLDYIRRDLIRNGELKRLVEEDRIRGVTSNPTIFEKANAGSTDYDDALRQRGTRVQRPLWASTGTKNPAYSDVLYVENLIGADTVNTLPPETLNAFKDHGQVAGETVRDSLDDAAAALGRLKALGINLDTITEKLQQDGVTAFATSFDQLLGALEKKRNSMIGAEPTRKV